MVFNLITVFEDEDELSRAGEFYQYYTNGKMTISQAAKEYGISGLTAAFYVSSFRSTKSNSTEKLTLQSSI